MEIENTLDRIHGKTVHSKFLQLFTSCLRVLLALGFIPPSISKITHQPFTILPTSNPVGYYFDALYKTGFYYDFIGWSQIVAALLLLIPRTSHLGALMFLPIIINITVLTNSVGFKGTWLITIFMTLACLYLVCWDFPRWKTVLFSGNKERPGFSLSQLSLIPFVFAGGIFFAVLAGTAVIYGPGSSSPIMAAALAGVAFIFGVIVAIHQRFMVFESADLASR